MICPKCGRLIIKPEHNLTDEGKCTNCGELLMTPEQLKEFATDEEMSKLKVYSKSKDGGVGKELSLITYADIRPPKNKKEATDLSRKLIQIKEGIDASYFTMGAILQVFYDEESFKLLGHNTFREYVDSMLGFGWRKAMYLIGIAEAFGEKGLVLSEKQKAGIEWSKMRELAALFKKGILNQENLNEWLGLAKTLGTRELIEKVKEAKGSAPTPEEDKMVGFMIKLFPGQVKIVNQAMEQAAQLTGWEVKGGNLEMICAEFLGGLQEPVARLNKLIESIERAYKVKIVYESVEVKTTGEPAPGKAKGKKDNPDNNGKPSNKEGSPSKGKANPGKGSKKESGKEEDNGLPYEE